jgi:FkbM family methyltransferase
MQGEFTRQRVKWALDLNEGIDLSIFLLGAFEPDVVNCYRHAIPRGSVVLDLGANIGAHTLHLARTVGQEGKVIAVEATAYAFGKMQANLRLNPDLVPQVRPVHALLVARDGEPVTMTELYSGWPLSAATSTHPIHGGRLHSVGQARTCTVDTLVSELALPRVDWIKIDVDGHELEVFEGARETLRVHRPAIIMELAPDYFTEPPNGFALLMEQLWSAGYELKHPGSDDPLPANAAELTALIPPGGGINVIARVPSR